MDGKLFEVSLEGRSSISKDRGKSVWCKILELIFIVKERGKIFVTRKRDEVWYRSEPMLEEEERLWQGEKEKMADTYERRGLIG